MKNSFLVKIIIIICLLGSATAIFATDPPDTSYTLLEPGVFGQAPDSKFAVTSFTDYANRIFSVLLTAAIALAILRIVLGGFSYITSATAGGKNEGKEMVTQALIGLAIILLSWLALYTVNPKLVVWDFTVEPLGKTTPAADMPQYEPAP